MERFIDYIVKKVLEMVQISCFFFCLMECNLQSRSRCFFFTCYGFFKQTGKEKSSFVCFFSFGWLCYVNLFGLFSEETVSTKCDELNGELLSYTGCLSCKGHLMGEYVLH